MVRHEIIKLIGEEYLISNTEKEEFNYRTAFKNENMIFQNPPEHLRKNQKNHTIVDLRFEHNNLSILVETKKFFKDEDEQQLNAYVFLEKILRPSNNIISILADSSNTSRRAKIWRNEELIDDNEINELSYYEELYKPHPVNNKEEVLKTTHELNNILHELGIKESLRSQFIGSCLVALRAGLFENCQNIESLDISFYPTAKSILDAIVDYLNIRLKNNKNQLEKIKVIKDVLSEQNIEQLTRQQLLIILKVVKNNLIPYIDDRTSYGEDLLNLFFTTFNKFVGKEDKNQAFTPMHITDFMSELIDLKADSRVLDPTCGSGSFLIQAMIKMIRLAGKNEKIKQRIKLQQIYGIEKERNAFGLATTNMLMHGDGKSNIICADCFSSNKDFNCAEWIKQNQIDRVLMNPPFNGRQMPLDCPRSTKSKNELSDNATFGKGIDATKGFYFVKYIADIVNQGFLCTILPYACAIGSSSIIKKYKQMMLDKHRLLAVFSLPQDIFYPGSSVASCIMLFALGQSHCYANGEPKSKTFFGFYQDDGFEKRKNLGRVEKINCKWEHTKARWMHAYKDELDLDGFSINRKVTAQDTWLAETYIKTDYGKLTENDFISSIRNYIGFKVINGDGNK